MPDEYAGRAGRCRSCGQAMIVSSLVEEILEGQIVEAPELVAGELATDLPVAVPAPPPQADPQDKQRRRSRRNYDHAEQGSKDQTRGRITLISILAGAPAGAIAGAAVGLMGFGFVGLILSQYWPVFGGFLELNFAQPWSPARINLIPVHLFAFGIAGILLGAGAGFLFGASLGSLIGFGVKTETNRRSR